MNLEQDLRDRWRPSAEQIRFADALIKAGANQDSTDGRGVYTTHLLLNKRYGFWTTDVQVVPLDGYFTNRDAAYYSLNAQVKAYRDKHPDAILTGGTTWHHSVGGWAVFEDIMTRNEDD